MHLLFIRHGLADRAAFTGADDDLRPLTPKGHRRTRRAMRGLAQLVPEVDLLASSPLTRARQTADIAAREIAVADDAPTTHAVVETDVLRPGADPQQLVAWLSARPELLGTAALVGHEPHLSTAVSWFLCGGYRSSIEVKKASAILLEVAGGRATLVFALPPKVLRALGTR